MRSALKNHVYALLVAHGLQRPYQQLFGPSDLRFLSELELREPPRKRLNSLFRLDLGVQLRDRLGQAGDR